MKGYKQTELGWIPEDWKIYTLQELGTFSKGRGILKEQLVDSGLPCIRYGEIYTHHNYFIKEFFSFIPEAVAKESQPITKGVVLFAGSGETLEDIGKAVAYDSDRIAFAGGDIIILSVTEKAQPVYLSYLLNADILNQQKRRLGKGHSVVHLYPSDLATLRVPLPHFAEQGRAVSVFKTWDKSIDTLTHLVAAKQQLKKGLMQQLLTGRKRLRGFIDKWNFVMLEDIADPSIKWSFTGGPFGSNLKSSEYTSDGIRIIQLQNIGDGEFINDYKIFASKEKADELSSCNIFPGEIIMSKMGDPVARATFIPNDDSRYLMSSDGIRLVPDKKQFDSKFVLEVINSFWFRKQAEEVSTGTTRRRIGLDELRKLKFPKPSLQEQQRLASIFVAMDKEITILKQRLILTREQKQGLMQQLLTGKKRVNLIQHEISHF